jgi:CheY-like chemotaxis protein
LSGSATSGRGNERVRCAALDRFRPGRYDLVTVDLIMPEMNGREVI